MDTPKNERFSRTGPGQKKADVTAQPAQIRARGEGYPPGQLPLLAPGVSQPKSNMASAATVRLVGLVLTLAATPFTLLLLHPLMWVFGFVFVPFVILGVCALINGEFPRLPGGRERPLPEGEDPA